MYYFAYGSNMLRRKLEQTVQGTVEDLGITILRGHNIVFNKLSTRDGTGKTNIITSVHNVLGVVYNLTNEQFTRLDGSEGGYYRAPITVEINGEIIEVQTYIANNNRINNELRPTRVYRQYLIDGAREHNFPVAYMEMLESIQTVD